MFLCKGYTLKSLPPNIRALSAFSLAACVEGTVGERQLSRGEEGSCPGDSRRPNKSVESN